MGSRAKMTIKKLKKTVILRPEKNLKIVLTQLKELYKGVSVYKIFTEFEFNGEHLGCTEFHTTHSREQSDNFFSVLETNYSETEIARKIF